MKHWLHPRTLPRFVHFVYHSFMHHQGLEVAKSLTYTSLFAVVPLFTLLMAILAAFPSFQGYAGQIQALLFNRLLPSTSNELQIYLLKFAGQARNLTWVGAGMLLVTAVLMLRSIEDSFNFIWAVKEPRQGFTSFLLYWCVLSLGPLLLGAGFAVSSYITSLALFERFTQISDQLGTDPVLLQLFPLLLTTLAFTLLYVAVPNCKVELRHGLAGAVGVTLSFVAAKWLFTLSIATASYELVYGTFAAIPIFLVWLYLCWVIILAGANLVRCLPLFSPHQHEMNVHPTLLALALLHRFWQVQEQGTSLNLQQLTKEQWPFTSTAMPQVLEFLQAQHLIMAVRPDEYILARNLEVVPLSGLLEAMPWPQPHSADLALSLPTLIATHLPASAGLLQHFANVTRFSAAEFPFAVSHYFR